MSVGLPVAPHPRTWRRPWQRYMYGSAGSARSGIPRACASARAVAGRVRTDWTHGKVPFERAGAGKTNQSSPMIAVYRMLDKAGIPRRKLTHALRAMVSDDDDTNGGAPKAAAKAKSARPIWTIRPDAWTGKRILLTKDLVTAAVEGERRRRPPGRRGESPD